RCPRRRESLARRRLRTSLPRSDPRSSRDEQSLDLGEKGTGIEVTPSDGVGIRPLPQDDRDAVTQADSLRGEPREPAVEATGVLSFPDSQAPQRGLDENHLLPDARRGIEERLVTASLERLGAGLSAVS